MGGWLTSDKKSRAKTIIINNSHDAGGKVMVVIEVMLVDGDECWFIFFQTPKKSLLRW